VESRLRKRFADASALGWAWVALTAALAIHVTDEARNDFLALYNPAVRRIRQALPFVPLPEFTFRWWLAGLVMAVVALALLSLFVFSGARWSRGAAVFFGTLMALNGLGHILGSLSSGQLLAGTWSAPLLLAAAIALLSISLRTTHRRSEASPRAELVGKQDASGP
jgi:hypothetical protein